jgi:NADH-quinone oxidoreductase subunit G
MRAADVPIYAVDALVRRAPSLQKTRDAVTLAASMNPADVKRLDAEDEVVSVKVTQGDASAVMKCIIDESVPEGSVWIPMAVRGSELLGDPFGEVVVEKV